MNASQKTPQMAESFVPQTPADLAAGDVVARGRVGAAPEPVTEDAAAAAARVGAQVAASRSPIVRVARFLLFLAFGFAGLVFILGAAFSALECVGSFYSTDYQFGAGLFGAIFFGYLAWVFLWLDLRVSPWAKPDRTSWRWVRITLAAGGVLLLTAALVAISGAISFIFKPVQIGSLHSSEELLGKWELVLEESSPMIGFADIESGTFEFRADRSATRVLRLKSHGTVSEQVIQLQGWKRLPSERLQFALPERHETHEIDMQLWNDRLSFSDWDTGSVLTYRRVPTPRSGGG